MGYFFTTLVDGVFGTKRRIWNLFHETALLLIVAVAVTPAFKMRFWNIGAEGQVLIGGLCCATCMFYLGGKMNIYALIPIMLVSSMVGGAIWAVIPAIFKAKWNTNETLFTLMMNYIAACLTGFMITTWAPRGSGVVYFEKGNLPKVGNEFLLKIIVVAALTVIMWAYLKFSKHGYELTVVGESERTAKYIGINVKKVIIRTLILCGIICGIAGFLLVSGTNQSIHKTDTVAGRGFTAILVSWLAHFNPLYMTVTSLLVIFIDQGTGQIATLQGLGNSYSDIMTGIFFFIIIASEFFINYKVVFKFSVLKKAKKFAETVPPAPEIETEVKEKEEVEE